MQSSSGDNTGASSAAQYVKLEQRLVMMAWLNGLLGYKYNRDLLEDMKKVEEGFDASGRSYTYHLLMARGSKVKISSVGLTRYDDNIREHLRVINTNMSEPITLRYFQYLAVLYA